MSCDCITRPIRSRYLPGSHFRSKEQCGCGVRDAIVLRARTLMASRTTCGAISGCAQLNALITRVTRTFPCIMCSREFSSCFTNSTPQCTCFLTYFYPPPRHGFCHQHSDGLARGSVSRALAFVPRQPSPDNKKQVNCLRTVSQRQFRLN